VMGREVVDEIASDEAGAPGDEDGGHEVDYTKFNSRDR
jgi:hypothetical protein